MNQSKRRELVLVVPTFLIVLVIAIGIWSLQQPTARAGSTQPDMPPLEWAPQNADVQQQALLEQGGSDNISDWSILFEDDFEDGIAPSDWQNSSEGTTGEYKWGTRAVSNTINTTSVNSAWAIGGGQVGRGT